MKSYKIPRHKVFVSYQHKNDQKFKDYLIKLDEYNPEKGSKQFIFDNRSVDQNGIDDTGMTNEQVRKKIRDDFIKDATVLILLCGRETRERKFVDWELQAAMYENPEKYKLGILVINLPTLNKQNGIYAGQKDEKGIVGVRHSEQRGTFQSRDEIQKKFPFLPSRIIDNFDAARTNDNIVPITVVEWDTVENKVGIIKKLIHSAYLRGRDKSLHYDYSAKLKGRNR